MSGGDNGNPLLLPGTWTKFDDLNLWIPVYSIPGYITTAINTAGNVVITGRQNLGTGYFFVAGVRSRYKFFPDASGRLRFWCRFENVVNRDPAGVINCGIGIVLHSENAFNAGIRSVAAYGIHPNGAANMGVGFFEALNDNTPFGTAVVEDVIALAADYTFECYFAVEEARRSNGTFYSYGLGCDVLESTYRIGGAGAYNVLASINNPRACQSAAAVGFDLFLGMCCNGMRNVYTARLVAVKMLYGFGILER